MRSTCTHFFHMKICAILSLYRPIKTRKWIFYKDHYCLFNSVNHHQLWCVFGAFSERGVVCLYIRLSRGYSHARTYPAPLDRSMFNHRNLDVYEYPLPVRRSSVRSNMSLFSLKETMCKVYSMITWSEVSYAVGIFPGLVCVFAWQRV